MRSSLRIFFEKALADIGYFIPVAQRLSSRMIARDAFKMVVEDKDSGLASLSKMLLRKSLEHAGYDPQTDKPYIEILKLKGGKAEFDRLVQP